MALSPYPLIELIIYFTNNINVRRIGFFRSPTCVWQHGGWVGKVAKRRLDYEKNSIL